MNLVIDIGNTAVKFFVFDGNGNCVRQSEGGCGDVAPLERLLEEVQVDHTIVSAVADTKEPLTSLIDSLRPKPLRVDEQTSLPIRNAYGSPHTLGTDRLAAVVGACAAFPGKDVLVIDMGTCITYDLVTSDGCYQGGNIAPGMRLRFQSMHEHTARLPLVSFDGEWEEGMGRTTEEALKLGVLQGILAETVACIRSLQQAKKDLQVVLTGGDSPVFYGQISKKYTNVAIDSMLVANGLNRILEYNGKEI